MYGRKTDLPSGSGTAQLTDKQQWIVEKCSFLKGHIGRIGGREGCEVNICLIVSFFPNILGDL